MYRWLMLRPVLQEPLEARLSCIKYGQMLPTGFVVFSPNFTNESKRFGNVYKETDLTIHFVYMYMHYDVVFVCLEIL